MNHGLAGAFGSLAEGFRNFLSLAEAEANVALAVANDDEGAEAETTATLHDLGNTVQTNNLFNVAGILLRLLLFHMLPALVVLADD
jgi:hypothetical protein